MNYKEVIVEQKISDYIAIHKHLYRTLSSMIFDISFLEACVDLQDPELESDWISVKFLHRDIFENLITKTYRAFFDNHGPDTTNLFKFKNLLLREFIKPEYRQTILETIRALPIESDEFKPRKVLLERNLLELRSGYIAHGLLNASDTACIDLRDIRQLVEYGCEFFQKLSFEPRSFYSFFEGDGFDFSKEFAFTHASTRNFIKYHYLSSQYISGIQCEFTEDCSPKTKEKLLQTIGELNSSKTPTSASNEE